MNDELDLSLPARGEKTPRGSKLVPVLLVLTLCLVLCDIAVSVARRGRRAAAGRRGSLPAEARKQLALKLEKQGLDAQAAEAWKEYLAAAAPNARESALIWYRIGTLFEQDDKSAQALDSYYRSESFFKAPEIAFDINRRAQDCLEKLGKFAALSREIGERSSLGPATNMEADAVIAEIGSEKITVGDMDRRIEDQIERHISAFASFMPDEERKKQKATMLKECMAPQRRRMLFEQFLVEELLYRQARETKLAEGTEVRAQLKNMERGLLAAKFLEKEYSTQIKITPGDLRLWYEAHKGEYIRPERARIAHALVADEQTAQKAIERAKAGEDFRKIVAEMSLDKQTREKDGELPGWIEKGTPSEALAYAKDADAIIFGTEPGKIAESFVKSQKGFHVIKLLEKQPPELKPFDEVQRKIYGQLRAEKEKEVRDTLLGELRGRYNVVIHQAAMPENQPQEDDPSQ